jgi:phosphatidylglycerol---prolipoprotein diacylglyceryl transferase
VTFPDFDPVLLQLGPFAIRWYALAYVAGILIGWRYAVALVRNLRLWGGREPTLTAAQVDDLILWIALGVILGGRLGSVIFYSPELIWTKPLNIFKIWEGGMSFHGGLIGVAIALLGFSRANRVDLLKLADLTAPCVPFGLFFGRIANFVNGELWGRPTDSAWGVVFCNSHIAKTYGGACPPHLMVPRHPSQLYEAALEGIVLFLILFWATHRKLWLQRRGVVAGLFLLFYAVFRIALETVRNPDEGLEDLPLGLTMGMYLSIPMLLAGAWLVWRGLREAPEPVPAEPAPPA